MAELNRVTGEVLLGIDGQVSVDGVEPAALLPYIAGGWKWIDHAKRIIGGQCAEASVASHDSAWRVCAIDLARPGSLLELAPRGASSFFGNGGEWAAGLQAPGPFGFFDSAGTVHAYPRFPVGVTDAGEPLSIDQQTPGDLTFEPDAGVIQAAVPTSVTCHDDLVVWASYADGRLHAFPGPDPAHVPCAPFVRFAVGTDAQQFVLRYLPGRGLAVSRWESTRGYVIPDTDDRAFNPDLAFIDGYLKIAVSATAGERPTHGRAFAVSLDALTETELLMPPVSAVVPVTRPFFFGAIAFRDSTPAGNIVLPIRPSHETPLTQDLIGTMESDTLMPDRTPHLEWVGEAGDDPPLESLIDQYAWLRVKYGRGLYVYQEASPLRDTVVAKLKAQDVAGPRWFLQAGETPAALAARMSTESLRLKARGVAQMPVLDLVLRPGRTDAQLAEIVVLASAVAARDGWLGAIRFAEAHEFGDDGVTVIGHRLALDPYLNAWFGGVTGKPAYPAPAPVVPPVPNPPVPPAPPTPPAPPAPPKEKTIMKTVVDLTPIVVVEVTEEPHGDKLALKLGNGQYYGVNHLGQKTEASVVGDDQLCEKVTRGYLFTNNFQGHKTFLVQFDQLVVVG